MNYAEKIIEEVECHSVEGIINCLKNGVNPNDIFKDKPLIEELITKYARDLNLNYVFKAFVDYGLEFNDKILLAVFLDDSV